ncbi:MAG: hypothetical protein JW874_14525 [Spirochaetales bacterium]|nr:hypothetical protein [Spirochaetales bacterium]
MISCTDPRGFVIDEYSVTPWLHTLEPTEDWTYHSYLYIPEDYAEGTADFPLLVHLHGWGNFGVEPGLSQLAQGALSPLYDAENNTLVDSGPDNLNSHVRESFVLYPRLHMGYPADIMGYWDTDALDLLIDYVRENYRIDENGLYITGLSYGGAGTWRYAIEKADGDCTVSWSESGLGPWEPGVVYPSGVVSFTIYQSGEHDAWTRTYSNDTVWTGFTRRQNNK